MSPRTITLLTDFGTRDYYVGAVKGVLRRLAPASLTVDISHDIAPGDVEEGSFVLAACHHEFPAETVHLAVVDPGVGSDRRILAVRSKTGFFVAPDNGLLTDIFAGAQVRTVRADDLFLRAPGNTFHGRDRFAPVAAYLARGEPFEELGPEIDDPFRLERDPPRRSADRLEGRVIHIDRFGNLITDIPSAWLEELGDHAPNQEPGKATLECRLPGLAIRRWARHYAQLEPGEAALLPGSLGTLEISLNGESAAARSGVERGQTLRVILRL